MHSQLGRNSLDSPNPELVFPTNVLKQSHLRSPLHPKPPASLAGCSALRGGPIQSIEVGSGRFRYRLTMPTIKHDGPREIEDERNPGASGPCGARNRGCLPYLQLRRVYGSRARSRNIRTKPMPSWLACAKSTVS